MASADMGKSEQIRGYLFSNIKVFEIGGDSSKGEIKRRGIQLQRGDLSAEEFE